jgi:hypothetical protein
MNKQLAVKIIFFSVCNGNIIFLPREKVATKEPHVFSKPYYLHEKSRRKNKMDDVMPILILIIIYI